MSEPRVIGGGAKKILGTLATLRRMGVGRAAKALTAKNTCKACGLGMGGQKGGMTNELGEFPSVCNKSIQAQSSDVQAAIPHGIFDHPLSDLRELSARELEHLGRLDTPLHKPAGDTRYRPIAWEEALDRAAAVFRGTEPSRTFFYSSGRSSNEAGFLLQLFARVYGTNNVNNCSYYCHQATSVALETTIGTGTSTVELADLKGADLIFVVGANPASNHPRFIHLLKDCRDRGGDVIVINPTREPGLVKFAVPKSPRSMLAGGSEIASLYLQPRIGSDIALFKGLAKAVVAAGAADQAFIERHSSGYESFRADLEATPWEKIESQTGLSRAEIEAAAAIYAKARNAVFAWGMGLTHHLHGVANIEALANLALLRGMVGRRHAGLLPLRGHSNVQGIGTIGVKPVLAEDVFARMEAELGITLPRHAGYDTMAAMKASHAGLVDAALMMGGNLFGSNPNAAWAEEALSRIPFKVFLTTTLNRGHIIGIDPGESLILPVTARDEEWEPTTQESMFNFVRLSDGGISRHAAIRPEVVILAELATRVLPAAPVDFSAFKSHRRIREAIARIVPGMEELADIDIAKREFHVRGRLLHTPAFGTADGRAHFRVTALSETGAAPFLLTTLRSEGQFNTIIYEEADVYRGVKERWAVLLNPEDIEALGLRPNAQVTLRSDHGRMENVAVYPFDLPRGNAAAYFPEANILTGDAVDPRSKTPAFKSTPIWIETS